MTTPPGEPAALAERGRITDEYTFDAVIGQGSFGVVHAAHRHADNESVVIKQVHIDTLSDSERNSAMQEASVLSEFNHANIIQYHDARCHDGHLYIVMEYAEGGDLATLIRQRSQLRRYFTEDQVLLWFVQICLALWHVHRKGFLHRDLKSSNVFIGKGDVVKLGDFGIARTLGGTNEMASTAVGTPYYLSPEICEDQPYNAKSDVWALGCILFELTTLKRAFDGHSLPALVVKILRGRIPPIPTKYSSNLRNLITSMLSQAPARRPTVDAILKLPWLRRHLERYADNMMALSCQELTSPNALHALAGMHPGDTQAAAPQQQVSAAQAPQHAAETPMQPRAGEAHAALQSEHYEESGGQRDVDAMSLSSLSSICSHPLLEDATACGGEDPHALVDTATTRTLRNATSPPPVSLPAILSPPARVRTQPAAASASGEPAACVLQEAAQCPPADVQSSAQAGASSVKQQIRGSWIAGSLAQLDELEKELVRCSPGSSPTRRAQHRQEAASARAECAARDASAAPRVPPPDTQPAAPAVAQQANDEAGRGVEQHATAVQQPPMRAGAGHQGQGGAAPMRPWRSNEPAAQRGSMGNTPPPKKTKSLAEVYEAQRAARRQCTQVHAQQRESKQREKQVAQQAHVALVRRAKPRLQRAELRKVGEQFAAQSIAAVNSKTAEQMSQAPAFIVPVAISPSAPRAQPPLGEQAGVHGAAAAPAAPAPRLWTESGAQEAAELRTASQNGRTHATQSTSAASIQASNALGTRDGAAKPWKLRSFHRSASDAPSVQIFLPAVDDREARQASAAGQLEGSGFVVVPSADKQRSGSGDSKVCVSSDICNNSELQDAAQPSAKRGELLVFSPPDNRLHQLRALTSMGEMQPPSPGSTPSPECSPLTRRRAALTDVQTFLDPCATEGPGLTLADANPSGQLRDEAVVRPASSWHGLREGAQSGARYRATAAAAGMGACVPCGSECEQTPQGECTATAADVEELRMRLESELGPAKLMAASQFLHHLDGEEHDRVVQAKIDELVAPRQDLAYAVYRLVRLEQRVFGC